MSPNKAIIILLTLFLLVAVGFVFLYVHKQLSDEISQINKLMPENNVGKSNNKADEAEAMQEKVEKIVERAKNNPTPENQEAARQAVNESLDIIRSSPVKVESGKEIQQKTSEMNNILDKIGSKK